MIDLHAHILPGLDDGPRSLDEAVAMAEVAVAAGTHAMTTTSHINHLFGLTPTDLAEKRTNLAARLAEEGLELELLPGGEIAPDRLPDLDDATLHGLALGGGRYVLLECPFMPRPDMDELVADLQERGFDVLLAHPERSPTFMDDPTRLADLVGQGALAQITTGSLAGDFGEAARHAAATMLRHDLVHVLASDAHDAFHRPPDLRAAGHELDAAQHEWMTEAVPAAILAGRPIPDRVRAW
jgi:protein-tyrosine phosphatase